MIKSVTVNKFRGFEHFEMHDLGRVNLLVGKNNSGKTSVLEAIQILTTGQIRSIWHALYRRGERLIDESARRPRSEVDICHLFHGHQIDVGTSFDIAGENDESHGKLEATITETTSEDIQQQPLFDDQEFPAPFSLQMTGSGFVKTHEKIPLSPMGGLSSEVFRRPRLGQVDDEYNSRFLATASMSPEEVVSLFESVVLKPEEELVIEALRTVEPAIERIATTSQDARYYRGYPGDKGGVVVKCKGVKQRIPIGSLGDGIWRILGLALALVHAENGVIFVDEIDTGLHFTVMSDMWKLVNETAKRLNVQVFATTHSHDAVDSLAAIAGQGNDDNEFVSIQRIERDLPHAISFTKQEIVVAADRGIEVR